MTRLRSLIRSDETGAHSPARRRAAVALAVLTPLLIAGVAVTALQAPTGADSAAAGPTTGAPAGSQPLLPAAVVNLDKAVDVGTDGTANPVLIGKLLVSDLTQGTSGAGFSWSVTDADSASAGLASGRYAAVVTIPADFTADYLSTTKVATDPTVVPAQAQLQVQTNGATGYATELLASALTTDLPSAVAAKLTDGYVSNTLSAFGTLHDELGTAASGAGQLGGYVQQSATGAGALGSGLQKAVDEGSTPLADGLGELSMGLDGVVTATADLPFYTDELAKGSAGVTDSIGVLKQGLADQTAASAGIDDRQKALEAGIAALSAEVPTLTPDEIQARLSTLQDEAAGIRVSSFAVTLGLGVDALGVTGLEAFSAVVSDGQTKLAEDIPPLTTGLAGAADGATKLAAGSVALSSGLQEAADRTGDLASGLGELATQTGALADGLQSASAAIPDYTPEQQTSIATVVTTPVVTTRTVADHTPSAAGAIAAVAVPLALWLGALAIYLLLAPFTRRALDSTASTLRVVLSALRPALLLGLAQAAVAAVLLVVVGAPVGHLVVGVSFAVLISAVFVLLHQGLVALLGQAGRMLSLALVVVQLVAAAVIIPDGLSSPLYTGLSTVLPLTHAVTGMQALLAGASFAVAAQEAAALVVFGLVGLALSLTAARRARARDTVPPVPQALSAANRDRTGPSRRASTAATA